MEGTEVGSSTGPENRSAGKHPDNRSMRLPSSIFGEQANIGLSRRFAKPIHLEVVMVQPHRSPPLLIDFLCFSHTKTLSHTRMDTNDTNYDAKVGTVGEVVSEANWIAPENPLEYDDVLKRSGCANLRVSGVMIAGGREEAIDCVRGVNYAFDDLWISPGGDGGIVLKGSIYGYFMSDIYFLCHGKKRDIEIGGFDNYWYPGRPPTRNGIIQRVSSADSTPVKIVLWDAEAPEVIEGNVKIVKVPWIVWFPYFCYRAVVVRLQGKKTT